MNSISRWYKSVPKVYFWGGVGVIALATLFGYRSFTSHPAVVTDAVSADPVVTLASVASLSSNSGPLPVTGNVTSLNQATVLAQSAGEVTHVYRKLGDDVAAGSIIAIFENSSQAAAVQQATGGYEASLAALERTKNGTTNNQKDISAINKTQAQTSLDNARVAAMTAIQNAYTNADDAVHAKGDVIFSNPRTANPTVNITSTNSQVIIDLQNKRPTVEDKVAALSVLNTQTNASSDIDAAIATAISHLQYISSFLDTEGTAISLAVVTPSYPASAISGYQSAIAAARAEISGSISALNGAKSAYDGAQTGVSVAGKQLDDTTVGGRPEDVAASAASVKTALGGLNAAQAQYEKTIIRSPISGTIVSLPIKQGDYLTNFARAAIISNASALEVVAQVTSDDAKTIEVGGHATLGEKKVKGVITRIAPAIDPTTNKVEIRIGITGDQGDLVDGQSIVVNLDRITQSSDKNAAAVDQQITIPITALKMTPSGPQVFTLSTSTTLDAHPITIGSILGDRVIVLTGLTPEMTIVSDARGLAVGEKVTIQNK